MCENIGNINVKHEKIRDIADRLAHGCVAYGNEEYGTSLKELHHFAEHVSAVQDYRQAYVMLTFFYKASNPSVDRPNEAESGADFVRLRHEVQECEGTFLLLQPVAYVLLAE